VGFLVRTNLSPGRGGVVTTPIISNWWLWARRSRVRTE